MACSNHLLHTTVFAIRKVATAYSLSLCTSVKLRYTHNMPRTPRVLNASKMPMQTTTPAAPKSPSSLVKHNGADRPRIYSPPPLPSSSLSLGQDAAQAPQHLLHGHVPRAHRLPFPAISFREPLGAEREHAVREALGRLPVLVELVHAIGELVDLELEGRLRGEDAPRRVCEKHAGGVCRGPLEDGELFGVEEGFVDGGEARGWMCSGG